MERLGDRWILQQSEQHVLEATKAIAAATSEPELSEYLNDPDPRIRRAANQKLWRLAPPPGVGAAL